MEEEREEEERLTELASTLSLDSSDIPEVEDGGGDKGKSPENAENGGVQDREEQTTQGTVQSNGEKEAVQVTEVYASTVCMCMYVRTCVHVYMCVKSVLWCLHDTYFNVVVCTYVLTGADRR